MKNVGSEGAIRLLGKFFFILGCFIYSSGVLCGRGWVEFDGYSYSYDSVPVKIEGELLFENGIFRVLDRGSDVVYYELSDRSPGGCDGLPVFSKITIDISMQKTLGSLTRRDIGVFCGTVSGRHQTIKLFILGGKENATLDFGDFSPNIRRSDRGEYISVVYRRMLTKHGGYSSVPYMFIYRLHYDASAFGFSPVFGNAYGDEYYAYYRSLLGSAPVGRDDGFLGPILAAALATGKPSVVCEVFGQFSFDGIGGNEFNSVLDELVLMGYPDFDVKNCKGD